MRFRKSATGLIFLVWAMPWVHAGTFAVGGGLFDITDDETETEMIEADYRFDRVVLDTPLGKLQPAVGFLGTADESWFVYAALFINWPVGPYLQITPMVGPGYYKKGNGSDLGHEIEFNNRIEVSVALPGDMRLGINFSHMSNAKLSSSNPGTNNLIVNLHFKF